MPSLTPAAYLLDLDGTLYAGDAAIPGAVDALGAPRGRGVPFRLVTNTTSRSRRMLVERLRGYGFRGRRRRRSSPRRSPASSCSGRPATAGWRPFVPGRRARGSGRPRAARAAPRAGRAPRPTRSSLGDLGERWTFALLQEAFEHLMAGAALVALSRDRYFRAGQRLALDAGPVRRRAGVRRGRHRRRGGEAQPRVLRGRGPEPRTRRPTASRDGGRRSLVGRRGGPARGPSGMAGPHRQVPGGRAARAAVIARTGSSPASPDRVLSRGGIFTSPRQIWSAFAVSASPAAA